MKSFCWQNIQQTQNFKTAHLEQVGNNDVLPFCPMENVIIEDGFVNVAVCVQWVCIRCLLWDQPVLRIHYHDLSLLSMPFCGRIPPLSWSWCSSHLDKMSPWHSPAHIPLIFHEMKLFKCWQLGNTSFKKECFPSGIARITPSPISGNFYIFFGRQK